MASGTLPKLEDQPEQFDYAKAAKAVGIESRRAPVPFGGGKQDPTPPNEWRERFKDFMRTSFRSSTVEAGLSELVVDRIAVGGATYLLRTPMTVAIRKPDNEFEAVLGKLEAVGIFGKGNSPDSARSKLNHAIHRNFQRLYKTHAMQRSEQDEAIWGELARLFDVEQYKENRSSFVKCSGQVTAVNEAGIVFDWSGGSELNLPNQVLEPEWGKIEAGDWCDAVIERRAGDWKILRAIFMGKINPPQQLSVEEAKELWKSLPKAKLYPID